MEEELNKKDKNGKPHGWWKEYWDPEKKELWKDLFYIHGNPQGEQKYFYRSGKKMFIVIWDNNKRKYLESHTPPLEHFTKTFFLKIK